MSNLFSHKQPRYPLLLTRAMNNERILQSPMSYFQISANTLASFSAVMVTSEPDTEERVPPLFDKTRPNTSGLFSLSASGANASAVLFLAVVIAAHSSPMLHKLSSS